MSLLYFKYYIVHLLSCPLVFLSTCFLVHLSSCPLVFLSACFLVHLSSCPHAFFSTCLLVHMYSLRPVDRILSTNGELRPFSKKGVIESVITDQLVEREREPWSVLLLKHKIAIQKLPYKTIKIVITAERPCNITIS